MLTGNTNSGGNQGYADSSDRSSLYGRTRATSNIDLVGHIENLDIKSPEIRKRGDAGRLNNADHATIDARRREPERTPFLGLQNRRFYTCFMNAILQCLIATPNFSDSLISLKMTPHLNRRSQY
jgi:ubiquitin C-terminal hydrolase